MIDPDSPSLRYVCADACERVPADGDSADLVQCSVCKGSWRCKNMFPFELAYFRGKMQPLKHCLHHRMKQRDKNKTDVGRRTQKRARESDVGRATARAYQKTEPYLAKRRRWKKTEAGKASSRRWWQSSAGKKSHKKKAKKQHERIKNDPILKMKKLLGNRIRELLRLSHSGLQYKSTSVSTMTGFADGCHLKEHIEATFVDGMTWSNHGLRGENTWNIGHRIAASMYDFSNPEDIKRCWSEDNIFAQWSIENQTLSTKLPDDEVLITIVHVFPVSWNGSMPSPYRREELERIARNHPSIRGAT